MNVPTIGISYDPKIDGFLDMIDMHPVCTYDEMNANKIVEEIGKRMNEKCNYDEKIKIFKEAGTKTLEKIVSEL